MALEDSPHTNPISVGDWHAAREAGVAFVGVVCERNNFQGVPVVVIRDFTDPGEVEQAMRRALTQRTVA